MEDLPKSKEIFCSDHAFIHGLELEDIEDAWANYLRIVFRGKPNEGEIAVVGYSRKGQMIELVGIERPFGILIYHAMTPPTQKMLIEVGLVAKGKQHESND